MDRAKAADALRRILETASQRHLQQPFRTSSELRSRCFPGAGGNIPRARLLDAYLQEYDAAHADWQLIAHGTWTWVEGHSDDLGSVRGELERIAGEAGRSRGIPAPHPGLSRERKGTKRLR